jgi:hypothetical protein
MHVSVRQWQNTRDDASQGSWVQVPYGGSPAAVAVFCILLYKERFSNTSRFLLSSALQQWTQAASTSSTALFSDVRVPSSHREMNEESNSTPQKNKPLGKVKKV